MPIHLLHLKDPQPRQGAELLWPRAFDGATCIRVPVSHRKLLVLDPDILPSEGAQ